MPALPVVHPPAGSAPPFDHAALRALPVDPLDHPGSRQVHHACFSRARPTPVSAPKALLVVDEVREMLGISADWARGEGFAQVFGGNALLPGMDPAAACYGGHQFGHWAGQLGDGRAITLGEALVNGGPYEVQLKGAGPTPYSRSADGRAVLRSSVRELLCSEAMHHLGVPTTRALALVSTGDPVWRDMFYDGRPEQEPGAIVTRVAPSFLRFGNFQIHAARGHLDPLRALLRYAIRTQFPSIPAGDDAEAAAALLAEVARRTAALVVGWERVGFVHGVMNTDNMSLLGLTIDYGPYGWIDAWDPDWTPNTTDAERRRYRFGQQPAVALWNLARFAEALLPLVGDVKPLEDALRAFGETWTPARARMWGDKLGLAEDRDGDVALVDELHQLLSAAETDMTVFFRALSDAPADADLAAARRLEPVRAALYDPAALRPALEARWLGWLERHAARARAEGRPAAERAAAMRAVNPRFVLRNYLAWRAYEQALAGDLEPVRELLDTLRNPYQDQPARSAFAAKRPDWAREKVGCTMLSCSS